MDFSRICPEPESRIWKMSEELIVKIKLSLQPEFVTGAYFLILTKLQGSTYIGFCKSTLYNLSIH